MASQSSSTGGDGNQDGSLRAAFASDRKSTRLNSSHVRISYAVFCLKKKQKITQAYGTVPIPAFYVVVIFEEVAAKNYFIGGKLPPKVSLFKIEPMARTTDSAGITSW